MALAAGDRLGPYEIIAPLGEGGMASVYRARQPSLGRDVAIKVIAERMASDEAFRARFRREAEVLARLEHPNIVPIHDYGEANGVAYIVYRYVPGGTLASLVGQVLPLAEVIELLAPVAAALDFAHARGVVHRDVKPGNILLTEERVPIVADFGLAALEDSATVARLTVSGAMLGTPGYMAPEQVRGDPVDGRADQYALAVMAFELLTGRLPFIADSAYAAMLKHVHEPPPLPSDYNSELGTEVEVALLTALAKDPNQRFPGCSAFVWALAGDEGALRRTGALQAGSRAGGASLPGRTTPALGNSMRRSTPAAPAPGAGAEAPTAMMPPTVMVEAAETRDPPAIAPSVEQPATDSALRAARPAHRLPRRRLLALAGGGAVFALGAGGAAVLLTRGGSSGRSGAPEAKGVAGASGPTVETLAGSLERGAGYTDGPAAQTQFDGPHGLAIDAAGTLYLADMNNQRIRKVTPNGTVSTLAGSGPPGKQAGGFADGEAAVARFNLPSGVAVDGAGTLFVADSLNHRVRKLATDGSVSTIAGSVAGLAEGRGPAARFNDPIDIAVDGAGTLYVADFFGHRIRKITPDGTVSTLAGSGAIGPNAGGFADGPGAQAQFNSPAGVAVDAAGNVYVADSGNHRIRKIAPNGLVSTLAGGASHGLVNGPAAQARFSSPWRIATGPGGALYVADTGNAAIRRIAPDGTVSTLAGSGATGSNNGPAGSARFSGPRGLAVASDGTVYVADFGNNVLRKILTR